MMNPLKIVEELIKTRDELKEISRTLYHKEKELDRLASELIEFLKHKKIIETRTVR